MSFNWGAFSEESERMGSEESVGSAELKKILDSFEAGEVLPEVSSFCQILVSGHKMELCLMFDPNVRSVCELERIHNLTQMGNPDR